MEHKAVKLMGENVSFFDSVAEPSFSGWRRSRTFVSAPALTVMNKFLLREFFEAFNHVMS